MGPSTAEIPRSGEPRQGNYSYSQVQQTPDRHRSAISNILCGAAKPASTHRHRSCPHSGACRICSEQLPRAGHNFQAAMSVGALVLGATPRLAELSLAMRMPNAPVA
jgi:hypothetical protein